MSLDFVANFLADLTWEAYQPGQNDDRAVLTGPVGALMYALVVFFQPFEVSEQGTPQMVEGSMDEDADEEDFEESSTSEDVDEGLLYEPSETDLSASS